MQSDVNCHLLRPVDICTEADTTRLRIKPVTRCGTGCAV